MEIVPQEKKIWAEFNLIEMKIFYATNLNFFENVKFNDLVSMCNYWIELSSELDISVTTDFDTFLISSKFLVSYEYFKEKSGFFLENSVLRLEFTQGVKEISFRTEKAFVDFIHFLPKEKQKCNCFFSTKIPFFRKITSEIQRKNKNEQKQRTMEEQRDMYKNLFEVLWTLLDNIDTASDIVKSNDKAYRDLVHEQQSRRWETGVSVDKEGFLFDDFKKLDPKQFCIL